MPDERDLAALRRARDSGLFRLKALTSLLTVAMVVLSGAVAALAAGTVAGRKIVHAIVHPARRTVVHRHRATVIPPPPQLPSVGSNESQAPSVPSQAPAPAPVQSTAPPVAVSGGS